MTFIGAVLALSPYWFAALLMVGWWLDRTAPVEPVRPRRELGWCLREYERRRAS